MDLVYHFLGPRFSSWLPTFPFHPSNESNNYSLLLSRGPLAKTFSDNSFLRRSNSCEAFDETDSGFSSTETEYNDLDEDIMTTPPTTLLNAPFSFKSNGFRPNTFDTLIDRNMYRFQTKSDHEWCPNSINFTNSSEKFDKIDQIANNFERTSLCNIQKVMASMEIADSLQGVSPGTPTDCIHVGIDFSSQSLPHLSPDAASSDYDENQPEDLNVAKKLVDPESSGSVLRPNSILTERPAKNGKKKKKEKKCPVIEDEDEGVDAGNQFSPFMLDFLAARDEDEDDEESPSSACVEDVIFWNANASSPKSKSTLSPSQTEPKPHPSNSCFLFEINVEALVSDLETSDTQDILFQDSPSTPLLPSASEETSMSPNIKVCDIEIQFGRADGDCASDNILNHVLISTKTDSVEGFNEADFEISFSQSHGDDTMEEHCGLPLSDEEEPLFTSSLSVLDIVNVVGPRQRRISTESWDSDWSDCDADAQGLVVLGDGAYDGDDDEIHRIWESFQTKVVSLGKQQPAFEDDVGDECESEDVTFSKQLKKVRFASQDNLVQVYVIEEEGEEEAARKGIWEEIARDRVRFRQRICETERRLMHVFVASHRDKMFRMFHMSGRCHCHDCPAASEGRDSQDSKEKRG